MRKRKLVSFCLALLLLSSCAAQSGRVSDVPPPRGEVCSESESALESESDMPETTEAETPAPETTEAETDAESESAAQADAVETAPAPADTEPPVPPQLPEDLHTNIDMPEAAFILKDIYDAVAAAAEAGVYFTDVEQEYYFGIGEEKRYHTASTVKAVYCHYLIVSGTDLNAEIPLEQVSRTSSSGKLTWNDIGSVFTVGELIEYSIRYSDNQAHRLLYETFGIAGYNRYVATLGSGGLPMDEVWEWSLVTPRKLSRAMLEIYRYGEKNSVLIDHLKNTELNTQIPAGTKYETAHKYGTNGGTDGYHDTAIVYAPGRAYVLTIMTHVDAERTEDENAVFRRVAELCDALHAVLFAD